MIQIETISSYVFMMLNKLGIIPIPTAWIVCEAYVICDATDEKKNQSTYFWAEEKSISRRVGRVSRTAGENKIFLHYILKYAFTIFVIFHALYAILVFLFTA